MSDAMKALQAKVGAVADGAFGKNTANAIAKHYDLSRNRAAHLLGQAHHESGGFKRTKEGLYYSTPERLMAVWPTRFKTVEDAMPYTKDPQKFTQIAWEMVTKRLTKAGCTLEKVFCNALANQT